LKNWEISLVEVVWVIASESNIWAIDKAILHKIHTVILNKFHAKDPGTLSSLAKLFKADIIIWNWWLPLIPKEVIEQFQWIILNQHPWPLRENGLDFGGKWMIWTRVTAARIIYLLKIWATGDELFTESTVHIMTEKFDEWFSVWVKKLDIKSEIEEYRNVIVNLNNLEEKKELLKELISDIQQKLLILEHENVAETIKAIWETKTAEKHSSYDEILVPEENAWILEESKQKAISLYPNG
jgi:folate-dependent phosphoribosylglycinamide formyltransferase PurN